MAIDFSSVLASAVHDMKNSLCLLLQSIENLSRKQESLDSEESEELARLHYEASRLNTNLLQLLSLYRSEKSQLPINIEEHFIEDLFAEVVAKNQLYIEQQGIDLHLSVPPDLAWFLDSDLITNLLSDILVNAMRYSNKKISMTAQEIDHQLVFTVEDNGDGYPQFMLDFDLTEMSGLQLTAGRTGLGLYFAKMIAEAHQAEDRKGTIQLANGGDLGGGVFTLRLP